MGRKPVDKERLDDPELKAEWIKQLSSVYLRNGLTKWTCLCTLGIQVDPLVVTRCIGKHFNTVLIDGHPFAGANLLADHASVLS